MAFERIDNRFLLCGNSRGAVSIVDFESYINYNSAVETYPLLYKIIQTRKKFSHQHMVNGCQWYPVDTTIFLTTGMDKLLKVWDSVQLIPVEDYKFIQPISNFHWTVSNTNASSLIAVATSSSNVSFIDPRIGHIPQNIRAKDQRVYSVRWLSPSKYILVTGSDQGKIAFWDIRSGRGKLEEVQSPGFSHSLSPKRRRSLAHIDRIVCLRSSKDGRFLISMTHDHKLCLWNHKLNLLSWTKLSDFDTSSHEVIPTDFDISDEGHKLWAFIPYANDLLLVNFLYPAFNDSKMIPMKYHTVLKLHGHFQKVISCGYRYGFQQIVTSSNDRSILIWEPAMDVLLHDSIETQIQQMYKDSFSDDEFV